MTHSKIMPLPFVPPIFAVFKHVLHVVSSRCIPLLSGIVCFVLRISLPIRWLDFETSHYIRCLLSLCDIQETNWYSTVLFRFHFLLASQAKHCKGLVPTDESMRTLILTNHQLMCATSYQLLQNTGCYSDHKDAYD